MFPVGVVALVRGQVPDHAEPKSRVSIDRFGELTQQPDLQEVSAITRVSILHRRSLPPRRQSQGLPLPEGADLPPIDSVDARPGAGPRAESVCGCLASLLCGVGRRCHARGDVPGTVRPSPRRTLPDAARGQGAGLRPEAIHITSCHNFNTSVHLDIVTCRERIGASPASGVKARSGSGWMGQPLRAVDHLGGQGRVQHDQRLLLRRRRAGLPQALDVLGRGRCPRGRREGVHVHPRQSPHA